MFGMGTGVTPPARPPGRLMSVCEKTVSIRSKFKVKPHGRLVLVGYRPYGPSTSSLSNS